MKLWHYTCRHAVDHIIAEHGLLRPNSKPGLQEKATEFAQDFYPGLKVHALPVVWLTDLDVRTHADAELLGLGGSEIGVCDRVEHRFSVRVPEGLQTAGAYHWQAWADANVEDQEWRALIELDRAPDRWWVADRPLAGARLDDSYRSPVSFTVDGVTLGRRR